MRRVWPAVALALALGACGEDCGQIDCGGPSLAVSTEGNGSVEVCVASTCVTKNTQRDNPDDKVAKATFSLSDLKQQSISVAQKDLPLTFKFTRTSDGLGAAGTTHAKWKKTQCDCGGWELAVK